MAAKKQVGSDTIKKKESHGGDWLDTSCQKNICIEKKLASKKLRIMYIQ